MGVETLPLRVTFGSRDEEATLRVDVMQPPKIDVATVHDVARTSFNRQHIESIHVMHRSVRNVDKGRQIAPPV